MGFEDAAANLQKLGRGDPKLCVAAPRSGPLGAAGAVVASNGVAIIEIETSIHQPPRTYDLGKDQLEAIEAEEKREKLPHDTAPAFAPKGHVGTHKSYQLVDAILLIAAEVWSKATCMYPWAILVGEDHNVPLPLKASVRAARAASVKNRAERDSSIPENHPYPDDVQFVHDGVQFASGKVQLMHPKRLACSSPKVRTAFAQFFLAYVMSKEWMQRYRHRRPCMILNLGEGTQPMVVAPRDTPAKDFPYAEDLNRELHRELQEAAALEPDEEVIVWPSGILLKRLPRVAEGDMGAMRHLCLILESVPLLGTPQRLVRDIQLVTTDSDLAFWSLWHMASSLDRGTEARPNVFWASHKSGVWNMKRLTELYQSLQDPKGVTDFLCFMMLNGCDFVFKKHLTDQIGRETIINAYMAFDAKYLDPVRCTSWVGRGEELVPHYAAHLERAVRWVHSWHRGHCDPSELPTWEDIAPLKAPKKINKNGKEQAVRTAPLPAREDLKLSLWNAVKTFEYVDSCGRSGPDCGVRKELREATQEFIGALKTARPSDDAAIPKPKEPKEPAEKKPRGPSNAKLAEEIERLKKKQKKLKKRLKKQRGSPKVKRSRSSSSTDAAEEGDDSEEEEEEEDGIDLECEEKLDDVPYREPAPAPHNGDAIAVAPDSMVDLYGSGEGDED